MAEKMNQGFGSFDGRGRLRRAGWHALIGALAALTASPAFAQQPPPQCARTITANVVAIDMPILNNRLGASNVNGMMFALRQDVVDIGSNKPEGLDGTVLQAGSVKLRDDKRPRPLVLRVAEGDCLTVNFQNLLTTQPNARNFVVDRDAPGNDPNPVTVDGTPQIPVTVDEQVADRRASFHVAGMQLLSAGGIANDGSYTGRNNTPLVLPGGSAVYRLYAEKEQVYQIVSYGALVGSDANQGNIANGLFGQLIVEPKDARIYRNTVTEEEMRLATKKAPCPTGSTAVAGLCRTPNGHPVLNYEATYPGLPGDGSVWAMEGKAGRTILNMIQNNVIVHTEIDAVVAGPCVSPGNPAGCTVAGGFPPSTYPLEAAGKRNPAYPNRLEPFRDFAQVWHDEVANAQAYPGFYNVAGFQPPLGQEADQLTTVFAYLLKGVRDKFMINYASGGIGTEILSNRLGVGPMYDCLGCAYEEFFLTHFTVGEVGQLVDIPANAGLETITPRNVLNILLALKAGGTVDDIVKRLTPAERQFALALGPKAERPFYPGDPANLNHSYIGDFVKFRNTHNGFEQHVFHLHNHQWLFNPNDDNSNYIDAQGIGPGMGYTYEIANGGSGNRNKSAGDAIFHCHFYPHFAQGMWYMWRIHDVMETGSVLQVSGGVDSFHSVPFALKDGTPLNNGPSLPPGVLPTTLTRALPDGELITGVPIPAVVPLPGKGLAPMPADGVTVVAVDRGDDPLGLNPRTGQSSQAKLLYKDVKDTQGNVVQRGIAGTDGIFGTRDDVNPGYPFWIAGIACGADDLTCEQGIVGQRPTTPPLDMVTKNEALALLTQEPYATAIADERITADEFLKLAGDYDQMHGGLPRHALHGVAAGGKAGPTIAGVVSPVDLTKFVKRAKPVYFPEGGTEAERSAMFFHSSGNIPTYALDLDPTAAIVGATFRVNRNPSVPGAAYADPCQDDDGMPVRSDGGDNLWNSASYADPLTPLKSGKFGAYKPRIYKGANIQYDAVINKVGYHYPQQRIVSLWEDALPVIEKNKPGEPLVMRMNTFDCTMYHHTNLVPETYEMDDYQLRTPTDIIGQHIHLPKWDLSTTDGAANGWNYEDGTLAAGAVRERIEAINVFNEEVQANLDAVAAALAEVPPRTLTPDQLPHPEVGLKKVGGPLEALQHPFFPATGPGGVNWKGARITLQRWFTDPVLNVQHVDRGLGVVFTHDHYGPSTFQQIGLYSTVLVQPAGSTWKHSETGSDLGCADATNDSLPMATALVNNTPCRNDGGPTSWQAAILTGDLDVDGRNDSYREFYFEYTDFQHAYEAGVYVGAGPKGEYNGSADEESYLRTAGLGAFADLFYPEPHHAPADGLFPGGLDTFRFAIAPPLIKPVAPIFPDLVLDKAVTLANGALSGAPAPGQEVAFVRECIQRPCPTSIDFLEPGMFVVNYRNEPGALRVYNPNKPGPDAPPLKDCSPLNLDRTGCGAQADGEAGDLAFVFQSRTDRAIPELNVMPAQGTIAGSIPDGFGAQVKRDADAIGLSATNRADTIFPPHINVAGVGPGDPFTPMMRTYAGDRVRIKAQAGGDEEEHSVSVHGMKWLKAGSAFGRAPNSGWVNQSSGGISEQFAFASPVLQDFNQNRAVGDYLYMMDAMQDGVWNGDWGIMRNYGRKQPDLYALPNNERPLVPSNRADFMTGELSVCPKNAPMKTFDITAVAANLVLPAVQGVTITPTGQQVLRAGTPDLQAVPDVNINTLHAGGPLTGTGTLVYNSRTTPVTGTAQHITVNETGPLHDPTALMYVLTSDLELDKQKRPTGKLKAGVPIEPLVLRVNAGDCVQITLRNRLPAVASDLPNYNMMRLANKRNRTHGIGTPNEGGSTYFGVNLVRPSSSVGFHTQLLEYDVTLSDGTNVGTNPTRTMTPGNATRTMVFYAGDLEINEKNRVTISGTQDAAPMTATAVEFGPVNILPADRVKQPQKGLFGQIVVMPRGATIHDPATGAAIASNKGVAVDVRAPALPALPPTGVDTSSNRLPATVGQEYRDFALVWQKMMNYRYASGNAVQNESEEGPGIPENPPHTQVSAANYRAEPTFFRFGIPPLSAAGNANCGGTVLPFRAPKAANPADVTCFGSVLNAGDLFSNVLTANADPETPVFKAKPGQLFRIGLTNPNSSNRAATFQLHGHVWPRDPFLALKRDAAGFPTNANIDNVGAVVIGDNPLQFYLGAQESIIGSAHYVIKPTTGAGGAFKVEGDYLFRDTAAAGMGGGAWGILRVCTPGSPGC